MKRAFKYRAVINKEIEANCYKWLWLCRTLYNMGLEQRIAARKLFKSISANEQMKQLVGLKSDFPEFKIVNSQTLQDVLQKLDKAFRVFFNREEFGFPRFKNRDRYKSFTLKQTGWKLEGRYLYIKNVGRFKLHLSRPIQGNIKTVTIKRSSTGKWFVTFSCDDVPARLLPANDVEIGIDVGINRFLVDSDGIPVENPQFFRQSEKLLRRRQRSLSRKKQGSNRRKKAKTLVAKTHEKIVNQRNDFCHKTANKFLEKAGTVYVENLNVKGMVKNKHLSKSISDSSWGKFFNMLAWKAEGAARRVIKVSARNTSQICSGCGRMVPKSLSVRIHRCPYCGLVIGRDHNAARNVLQRGQRCQALTSAVAGVA